MEFFTQDWIVLFSTIPSLIKKGAQKFIEEYGLDLENVEGVKKQEH